MRTNGSSEIEPNLVGGPSQMSAVTSVTDTSFEQEVLKAEVPVLVDFWAPWCGPCKAVAPVVEDLSKEYEGRIKVVKLNTDENPKTAQAYTIRGIPSLYLFKSGQVVEQVVGAVPKATLATAINKHV
jgi:thioredoxin 1